MSYAAAIDQLNALAPELFTQPGRPRRKFSLAEIGMLLRELGDPQKEFKSVLIAGTNGKGSTASTLASILNVAGLRVGLYTSPHLERANERIRINRLEIADEDFARQFFAVRSAGDRLVANGSLPQAPSFFETLTAMAFLAFAEARVDIAVLEVGLGGRLDATNIVEPLISVITDISFDHTEWLGSTLGAIAKEKAGILRPSGVLVTLPQHPEANQAIGEVAVDLAVRGVSATVYMPPLTAPHDRPYPLEVMETEIEVDSPLHGAHQHRNVALAIATAVELVEHHGFAITPQHIAEGIRTTEWPGRLEVLHTGAQTWVLDVAHNPAGAWALRAGLRDLFPDAAPQVLIFGCLKDKPLAEMAQVLFPLFREVIFAPIASPRAASMGDLLTAAEATGVKATGACNIQNALDLSKRFAAGTPVVISGSVYLVGDARAHLRGRS